MDKVTKWIVAFGDTGADEVEGVCGAELFDTQEEAVRAAREHAAEDAESLDEEPREEGDCEGLPKAVYVETADGRIAAYRIRPVAVTVKTDPPPTDGMNLQEMSIALGLTSLQVVSLNGIASEIKDGEDCYESYDGSLSPAEDKYLRAWLAKEGVSIEA